MSYGTFSPSIPIGYKKTTYTLGTSSYSINVYKTNSSTQLIGPAVSTSYSTLANLTIPGVTVTSKVNGNPNNYGDFPSFYGLFYVNQALYKDGKLLNGISDPYLFDASNPIGPQYYPQFCVKTNNNCTIKWVTTTTDLQNTMNACYNIIGTTHPLVYTGTTTAYGTTTITDSVFEKEIYASDHIRVANGNNIYDSNCHFNGNILYGQITSPAHRTFIGHIPGGTYVMVVTDDTMTLMTGAKLMYDLGCDFAANLDGGPASQMRYNGTRVSSSGSDTYTQGTAICAFNK